MQVLEQFSLAFRAAPGPMLITGADGVIIFSNHALESLFEYDEGSLVGQPIEVLVPKNVRDHHPELRSAYQHLPSSRQMGTGRDLFGVSRTGRLIPVEIGLNHVSSGEEVYTVASVLDITERKKEAEQTRLAIDAASSAMIMTDADGIVVLANTQAFEMFGYTAGELIGQSVEMLIPEKTRRRHGVYRTSYTADPSKRTMGDGRDLNGRRKDGSEFPLEIGLTPIDSHGERLIMATVMDVSERKAAEAEIRRKNADLTRLNEDLARFAYSASHDLKAPLSTIEGLVNCIEEDLADGDLSMIGSHASKVKKMSQQLKQLVEDILGLSRADNLHERVEEIQIASIIDDVLSQHGRLIGEKDVSVNVTVDDGCCIHAQPTRIKQILANLIGNSVSYSDPHKPKRVVEVVAKTIKKRLELAVEDNGIGIPKCSHAEVFKVFRRFHNHENPGTGLGLALVKQHAESLGAEISFVSSDAGTRFFLSIPTKQRMVNV